jgi:hypothetical protein
MRFFHAMIAGILGAAFVFAAIGAAQEEAPPIPDQVKKLYIFEGNWQGQGTMTEAGQPPKNITVSHKTAIMPCKWGMLIDERMTLPGMTPYIASDMMGYDAGGDMVHLYTVSNYGDTHDHKGKWVDDKHLMLEYDGLYDGKPFVERLTITVLDSQSYSFTDSITVGGQLFQTGRASMKKMMK